MSTCGSRILGRSFRISLPQQVPCDGTEQSHGWGNLLYAVFWDGPEHLKAKLNEQLLTYQTWRDCRVALIVFNRNKKFSDVVKKMRETIDKHALKVKKLEYSHESGCRYIFHRKDDPEKHYLLTALAFEVPH